MKVKCLPLIIFFSFKLFAQTYDGPAFGNVQGGAIVSTEDFLTAPSLGEPEEKGIRNTIKPDNEPKFINFENKALPQKVFYYEDPSLVHKESSELISSILLKNFTGIGQTNSIPPDPHIAAGPTHIMATVNSSFAIWDKEGNLIKLINADNWYNSVLSSVGAFDPKVLYDHIDKRWIMVWLDQNDGTQRGNFLLSVSDDSIPTGTWYNWVLPSNKIGDSTVNNWGDYQGVGFDKDAIYISANQFQFSGSFQHVKIRIVPKAQLYNNTAGPVIYNDLWNVTYPENVGGNVFNIRPSISYSNSSDYYLMHAPSGGANFISVYKIIDPLTNPVLTGVNVPVNFYQSAPTADQLGGSTIPIEGGGSAIRNEPTFRDGYLWAVHSIRTPGASQYSSVRYVKIDVNSNTAVEDVSFGASGYWHFYSAVAVDKDYNVAITYSRSGDDEYIGAFYTTRLNSDPPGLSGSKSLQTGKANYVKDFGSGRNRWGDYNGIWLDPATENNFWMFTEYTSASNTWGTWTGELRLALYPGAFIITETPLLDFGNVEVNFISDTLKAKIINWGEEQLTITSIADSVGPFKLISNLSYPFNLQSYESMEIEFLFMPKSPGLYSEILPVTSNDPNFELTLKGKGFKINAATNNIIYASSGNMNNGELLTINELNGLGTLIGPSLFEEVISISINPKTNLLYGIVQSNNQTSIIRINASEGDAYTYFSFPLENMESISFDTSGVLYGILKTGEIYEINFEDSSYIFISKAEANISSIAFNPFTNELWASALVIVGSNKDRIFKIDLQSGDTTNIGNTGLNVAANALVFDNAGNLYGVTGSTGAINSFIKIDISNAAGTLLGPIGFKHITGLAYVKSSVVSVSENQLVQIPSDFLLEQNYPNPFNPSTTIEFALPISSNVKLTIYNLLGEVVNLLFDEEKEAGYHKIIWNSKSRNGNSLSSGIYFYELKASAKNGFEFSKMRKMILLK